MNSSSADIQEYLHKAIAEQALAWGLKFRLAQNGEYENMLEAVLYDEATQESSENAWVIKLTATKCPKQDIVFFAQPAMRFGDGSWEWSNALIKTDDGLGLNPTQHWVLSNPDRWQVMMPAAEYVDVVRKTFDYNKACIARDALNKQIVDSLKEKFDVGSRGEFDLEDVRCNIKQTLSGAQLQLSLMVESEEELHQFLEMVRSARSSRNELTGVKPSITL